MREVVRLESATVFADGGALYVGDREVDPASPVGLLPLLEMEPDALSAGTLEELPMNQILTLALGWESDWWPSHAVNWLAKTGIPPEIRPALQDFAESKRGTQESRHAAQRLLTTG